MTSKTKSKILPVRFFLVEGKSDKVSLEAVLEKIYLENTIIVHFYGGDIITDPKTNHRNIKERIWNETGYYRKQMNLRSSHFAEIVQITDTDGTFVNNRHAVSENSKRTRKKNGKSKFFYDVEQGVIRAQCKQRIIERNEKKRELLEELVDCRSIHGIPYRILFMSCNLDHVLHNEANADEDDKIKMSNQFAMEYGDNPSGFIDLFTKSDYCVPGNYLQSWEYIRDEWHDKRSLERHSNFGIALQECLSSLDAL